MFNESFRTRVKTRMVNHGADVLIENLLLLIQKKCVIKMPERKEPDDTIFIVSTVTEVSPKPSEALS